MRLRIAFVLIAVAIVLASCGGKSYDPAEWLTPQEQYDNVWKIIRYVARSPDGVKRPELFEAQYDNHYKEQVSVHRLDAYYIDKETNTHYFLISRRAPSMIDKRVATGGKMKIDDKGELLGYEEVFRTWKMVDSTQIRKSVFLFDRMVKGETLEPYLTKNSTPEEYIEFPDDRVYYDKAEREWKSKPLEF